MTSPGSTIGPIPLALFIVGSQVALRMGCQAPHPDAHQLVEEEEDHTY